MAEDRTADATMSQHETYLGDGLFCSFDGYRIRLRAPRGADGDHEVFLEPSTLAAFIEFLDTLPIQRGKP